ncbi:Beta-1,3-galactosyltransferase 6-like [Oopsacas minuta]|uniref:Hexosyltransferase n=1 Tax=Oopsacas minuta TaxID=111878 RepID=A0AAV7K0V4_9METZ|nr:Beta-1,3-galactosyltransferase 6-like [Oopsacas minuta]
MTAVQEETAKYGDILILSGIEEKFTKLSRKVLKGFVWAGEHIDAAYYIKTDDDCYVFIENLLKALTNVNIPTNKLLMSYIHSDTHILATGKWAEFGYFLCPNYLPYPAGAGYIITQDVVRYLTINSERLMHYNNDDTALGSWVAPLNIEYLHDERVKILEWNKSYACISWLKHGLNPKTMKKMHFMWLKTKESCSKKV